jgi:hypothetical protein
VPSCDRLQELAHAPSAAELGLAIGPTLADNGTRFDGLTLARGYILSNRHREQANSDEQWRILATVIEKGGGRRLQSTLLGLSRKLRRVQFYEIFIPSIEKKDKGG